VEGGGGQREEEIPITLANRRRLRCRARLAPLPARTPSPPSSPFPSVSPLGRGLRAVHACARATLSISLLRAAVAGGRSRVRRA
jgi:hypothetical protein